MKNLELDTHIFPFLWMHGEPHEQLEREILAIYNCGIRMFCVESRPHPAFCEQGWWEDFGFVLEVAKRYGMKVWLLDDKHFPTGYANGIVEKYPHLKQKYIKAIPTDFIGDGQPCRLILHYYSDDIPTAAFVYKRSGGGHELNLESGKEIDITTALKNKVFSLPAGFYGHCRLVVLYKSTRFSEFSNYIDMLNPESAALQIEAVYQSNYNHFSEYFGNTLIGFFSDEPRFGNWKYDNRQNADFYNIKVGTFAIA